MRPQSAMPPPAPCPPWYLLRCLWPFRLAPPPPPPPLPMGIEGAAQSTTPAALRPAATVGPCCVCSFHRGQEDLKAARLDVYFAGVRCPLASGRLVLGQELGTSDLSSFQITQVHWAARNNHPSWRHRAIPSPRAAKYVAQIHWVARNINPNQFPRVTAVKLEPP